MQDLAEVQTTVPSLGVRASKDVDRQGPAGYHRGHNSVSTADKLAQKAKGPGRKLVQVQKSSAEAAPDGARGRDEVGLIMRAVWSPGTQIIATACGSRVWARAY